MKSCSKTDTAVRVVRARVELDQPPTVYVAMNRKPEGIFFLKHSLQDRKDAHFGLPTGGFHKEKDTWNADR